MKNQTITQFSRNGFLAAIIALPLAYSAQGGLPFNNLEGVGGAAFNPLAYPSGQNKDATSSNALEDVVSKPQFGTWYVRLNAKDIDWNAIGASFTILDRVELSYGYEAVAIGGALNIHKNSIGAKVLLVPENAGDSKFVPAIAIGAIHKSTSQVVVPNSDNNGVDFYAVATKLVTQLPLPVLISGGALSSSEYITGVAGFDDDRKITGFANVDVILPISVAVGAEFKQGEKYSSFENANYWDAHLAWLASKNLTLIGAYVNAGDKDKTTPYGLGQGVVVSAQYAF